MKILRFLTVVAVAALSIGAYLHLHPDQARRVRSALGTLHQQASGSDAAAPARSAAVEPPARAELSELSELSGAAHDSPAGLRARRWWTMSVGPGSRLLFHSTPGDGISMPVSFWLVRDGRIVDLPPEPEGSRAPGGGWLEPLMDWDLGFRSVACEDVNRDGWVDLVIRAEGEEKTVTVLDLRRRSVRVYREPTLPDWGRWSNLHSCGNSPVVDGPNGR